MGPDAAANNALTRPSEIDNGDLESSDYAGVLRPKLVEHTDHELVPEKMWTAMVGWYGVGGKRAFPRKCIRDGVVELYP